MKKQLMAFLLCTAASCSLNADNTELTFGTLSGKGYNTTSLEGITGFAKFYTGHTLRTTDETRRVELACITCIETANKSKEKAL